MWERIKERVIKPLTREPRLAFGFMKNIPELAQEECARKAFRRKILAHARRGGVIEQAELVHDGISKTLFKVYVKGKPKALSIIRAPSDWSEFEEFLGGILKHKKWYEKYFSSYINNEKLIVSSKDRRNIFCIQDWVESKRGYEEIFFNIPNEYSRIVEKAKEDEKFRNQTREFARAVIRAYKETETLPDIFSYIPGTPSNIIYSNDDRIVIVDMHLAIPLKLLPDEYLEEFGKALKAFGVLSNL